ncbi:MAG: ATPase, partial [Clostridia bacterium]|nr:ATPase [Clostridia bacterium]
NPGAVDEIVNFGDFWNEEGFAVERDTILSLNKDVKSLFNSSYHYLLSAKEMQDDIESAAEEAVDKVKSNKILLDLKAELTDNLEAAGEAGKERHLFDSAITPDGLMDYIDTLIKDDYKCYFFEGLHTKGISEILNILAKEYLLKGYDVEIYHQPLNPDRIQTVLVEELGLAFTVNYKMKKKSYKLVDLDEVIIPEKLEGKKDLIAKDSEMKNMLLQEAYKRVYMAKKKHDDMEKSYVPNMDFAAVTEFRKKFIERLKKYL